MNAFSIGISAIAAANRAIDLIGQNIANANTPGYHRQRINFANRVYDGVHGVGVDVVSLTRFEAQPIRTAILRGNSDAGAIDARLGVRRQIEASLGSATGDIGSGLENFFNSLEQLTARPDEVALRRTSLGTAADLATRFRNTATDLDRLRTNLGQQITQTVNEVNSFAARIAELNTRIAHVEGGGQQANDLRDQRDQLIHELSQRIDVRIVEQPLGVVNVITSGTAVVVGEFANKLELSSTPSGNLVVFPTGTTQSLTFASGQLSGQLREYNQDLPAVRSRLDQLAAALIQNINQRHATGIGTAGLLTTTTSTIPVADVTQPLSTQNLPFLIQNGQLTVSVTDITAGTRSNTVISIDPSVMSLQDLATAFSAVPGLSASVNTTSGTIQITSLPGYEFDFAGRDTVPSSGGGVSNPDTAGILVGLGINGLFTGTNAASIAVRPDILADPRLLSASLSGQPGDSGNLERLAAVRDQQLLSGRTFSADYAEIAAGVGTDVLLLRDQKMTQDGLLLNLFGQEQSVIGVDINEEMLNLLTFQRMIEGASKYMATVNEALDSILAMLG
jgi:flagellar hook-associated protein FlgK